MRWKENVAPRTAGALCAAGISMFTLALFWPRLKDLVNLSLQDDRYFQTLTAPLLCTFLIWWERKKIFSNARFSPNIGIPLLSLALALSVAVRVVLGWIQGRQAILELVVCSILLTAIAAFILCYGVESFKRALFPFACLLLMIPPPAALMDEVTVTLQHASSATSFVMLRLIGVPVFRDGTIFQLPGLTIEVAPECSGIRAALAFLITGILVGRVCFGAGWRGLVLMASTIPIAIFKNAARIVILSSLGVYVDPKILDSPLHHQGGPVFALIGIAILIPLLLALRKTETRPARKRAVDNALKQPTAQSA